MGDYKNAWHYWDMMKQLHVEPDSFSYGFLILIAVKENNWTKLEELVAEMRIEMVPITDLVYTYIIQGMSTVIVFCC